MVLAGETDKRSKLWALDVSLYKMQNPGVFAFAIDVYDDERFVLLLLSTSNVSIDLAVPQDASWVHPNRQFDLL